MDSVSSFREEVKRKAKEAGKVGEVGELVRRINQEGMKVRQDIINATVDGGTDRVVEIGNLPLPEKFVAGIRKRMRAWAKN